MQTILDYIEVHCAIIPAVYYSVHQWAIMDFPCAIMQKQRPFEPLFLC